MLFYKRIFFYYFNQNRIDFSFMWRVTEKIQILVSFSCFPEILQSTPGVSDCPECSEAHAAGAGARLRATPGIQPFGSRAGATAALCTWRRGRGGGEESL